MAAEYKLEILRAVEACSLPVQQALRQLGIPRSTYYRWRAGLHDRPVSRSRVWNQMLPAERDQVLKIALLYLQSGPRAKSAVTSRIGAALRSPSRRSIES